MPWIVRSCSLQVDRETGSGLASDDSDTTAIIRRNIPRNDEAKPKATKLIQNLPTKKASSDDTEEPIA